MWQAGMVAHALDPRNQRQVDLCAFEASLVYVVQLNYTHTHTSMSIDMYIYTYIYDIEVKKDYVGRGKDLKGEKQKRITEKKGKYRMMSLICRL